MATNLDVKQSRLQPLRLHLASIPPGKVEDAAVLGQILAECWDELEGGDAGGMEGYKLRGRLENVAWEPPFLTFRIERHGGTVCGSKNAELQYWTVNLSEGAATIGAIGTRRLYSYEKKLDVKPLALDVAKAIVAKQQDHRLKWGKDGTVRVLLAIIIPAESIAKQTLTGRRKRFRIALAEQLAETGWKEIRSAVYSKPMPS